MDLQEALRELGVDADSDGIAVRRAYLRQLKTRGPETDPEGFARLHAAYETVLAMLEEREALRIREKQLVAPVRTAGSSEATSVPPDVLEPFRAEFEALPPDAPPEALVEVARRAVGSWPDVAEAWTWLIDALDDADRKAEAADACREAYQRGHVEFLMRLAQEFPHALDEAEILLVESHPSHGLLWRLVEELLYSGGPVQAMRCATRAFEHIGAEPSEPPPPDWFARMVLMMHKGSQPDLAVQLTRRYAAWLQAEGITDAFTRPDAERFWRRAEQLNALPDDFSPDLRIVLATVSLTGERDSARAACQKLMEQLPEEIREAIGIVRRQAPDLDSLLELSARPLRAPSRLASAWKSFQKSLGTTEGRGTWSAMAFMLFLGFRLLSGNGASTNAGERPSVMEARRVAWGLCQQFPLDARKQRCGQFQQVVTWATTDRCPRAHTEWSTLRAELDAWVAARAPQADPMVELERVKRYQEEFRRSLWVLCPP